MIDKSKVICLEVNGDCLCFGVISKPSMYLLHRHAISLLQANKVQALFKPRPLPPVKGIKPIAPKPKLIIRIPRIFICPAKKENGECVPLNKKELLELLHKEKIPAKDDLPYDVLAAAYNIGKGIDWKAFFKKMSSKMSEAERWQAIRIIISCAEEVNKEIAMNINGELKFVFFDNRYLPKDFVGAIKRQMVGEGEYQLPEMTGKPPLRKEKEKREEEKEKKTIASKEWLPLLVGGGITLFALMK